MQPVVVPLPPDQEKLTSSPDHWISMPEPVHEPPPPPVDDGVDAADVAVPVPVLTPVSVGWTAEVAVSVATEVGSATEVGAATALVAAVAVSTGGVLAGGTLAGGGTLGRPPPPGPWWYCADAIKGETRHSNDIERA